MRLLYEEIRQRGAELYEWSDVVSLFRGLMEEELVEDTIDELFEGGKLALWHSQNATSSRCRVGLPDNPRLVPPSLFFEARSGEHMEQLRNRDYEDHDFTVLYKGYLRTEEDAAMLQMHLEQRAALAKRIEEEDAAKSQSKRARLE